MEIVTGSLANRAMSSFALSIGTALALESLFQGRGNVPVYDPERVVPVQLDIKNYAGMWVNLSTLVRNIYSSVPTSEQASLMGVDLYLTLESEVDIIRSLITEDSLGKTKSVFYVTEHDRLAAKHPYAKFRVDTTDKQRQYTALKDAVINEFLKRHRNIPGVSVYKERLTPQQPTKTLILTHDAYDLLSYPSFTELHLLESHTGLLKTKTQWYTKYTNGKDLMRIPFNSCFMQVFGDSLHFHPFALKERQAVKELADERGWTTLTTKERLIYSFDRLKDQVLSKMLKEMLKE